MSSTIYGGCGDKVDKEMNRKGCDDPGKNGHKTSTKWLGSTRKLGKCGLPTCKNP